MPNTYPPPHVHSGAFDERLIDPELLIAETLATADDNSPDDDLDGFFTSADIDAFMMMTAESTKRTLPPPRHPGVLAIEHHEHTHPPYFVSRGIFSDAQKTIIKEFSADTPAPVMERLQSHDPFMKQTHKQVKGVVENERRKRNRRAATGAWTEQEVQVVKQNTHLPPAELVKMLKEIIPGCLKNVDQVREMKAHLRNKTKDKGKTARISEDAAVEAAVREEETEQEQTFTS
jgi:hypothetical protein